MVGWIYGSSFSSPRVYPPSTTAIAAYVTYLESGKRSPSATVIARYWKFVPR
jgi:hypothetical protein